MTDQPDPALRTDARGVSLDPALVPLARKAHTRALVLFLFACVDLAVCVAGAYTQHDLVWLIAFVVFLVFALFTLGLWLAVRRRLIALERAAGLRPLPPPMQQ
ncbi:MAG TPA: hypothetical protein VGD03_11150 [Frankiaceae bacterium]